MISNIGKVFMKPKFLALMGAASFCVRESGRKRYSGQQELATEN
ncbi:hypothetical protein [Flavobacterium collinsii]|nr:hypothetical protein [Flavobacterium collinsii]